MKHLIWLLSLFAVFPATAQHQGHGETSYQKNPDQPVEGTSLMDDNDFPLHHMMDDAVFWQFLGDQLEFQKPGSGEDILVWESQYWRGTDMNRFWMKTEGEYAHEHFEEAELQLLYSRAVSPFWNLQTGIRLDYESGPSRNWAVLALQGLAPYFLETEFSLFLGEDGLAGLRLEGEYEMLITQRWILSPEIEINLFSDDDRDSGIRAGLADLEFGLRLRYEIKREVAPYLGLEWSRQFGISDGAEEKRGFKALAGLRFWF